MSLPHREKIPAPKEVNVVSGENHDGDPAFFLTVVFAKKEAPAKFPLKKLRPCIEGVTRRCGEGMRRRDAAKGCGEGMRRRDAAKGCGEGMRRLFGGLSIMLTSVFMVVNFADKHG